MGMKNIIAQALIQVGIDQSQMKQGTAQMATSLKSMDRPLNNLSNGFKNLNSEFFRASFVLAGLSASLIFVQKAMGKVAYEYNKNMTIIQAVTGATKEEMKDLDEIARDMGQGTIFGARKAAEGLLVLSRMGLQAAESMQVLSPAMKLAQGQQYDMTQTTELLISQLRAFGEDMGQASRYANVLAATSSKTAADLEKLQLSLSYVGPIAKLAGISFEELNATLGLMFNAGIKASRAGTSLRFAIAALLGATSASEKALAKLGLTIADVSPSTHSMSEIFTTLASRLSGVQNRAELLFDIFGKRAAPAMGAVLNAVMQNADAFDELKSKITDTNEVQRQFNTQMNSWYGQINLLGTAIEELSLEFGEVMLPALKGLTGILGNVVNGFKNLSPAMKEIIGNTALIITGALTAATALTSLGFIISTIVALFKGLSAIMLIGAGTLGLWTAGISIAIGLIGALVIHVAKVKRQQEEMYAAVSDLNNIYEAQKKVLDGLISIENKDEEVLKRIRIEREKLEEIEQQLIETNSDLIAGYDWERKALILNTDALKDYIEQKQKKLKLDLSSTDDKAFKSIVDQTNSFIDSVEKLGKLDQSQPLREFASRLKGELIIIRDEMDITENKLGEMKRKLEENTGISFDKFGGRAAEASIGTGAAASGIGDYSKIQELEGSYGKLTKKMQEYSKAADLINKALDKSAVSLIPTASKAFENLEDDIDGLGKSSKETIKHLSGLLNRLRAFIDNLEELSKLKQFELEFFDANELSKQIAKYDVEFDKSVENITDKLRNMEDDLEAKKLDPKVSLIDIKDAELKIEQARKLMGSLMDTWFDVNEKMKDKFREDFMKDMIKSTAKIKSENLKIAGEIDNIWSDSLTSRLYKVKIAEEESLLDITERKHEIFQDYLDAKERGEEEAANKYLVMYNDLTKQEVLVKKKAEKEKSKVVIDEVKLHQEMEQRLYNNNVLNTTMQYKKQSDLAREYYNTVIVEMNRTEHEVLNAYDSMIDAQREYEQQAISSFEKIFASVTGFVSGISSDFDEISDILGGAANFGSSFGEMDIAGMIAAILELATSIIGNVKKWEKEAEEERERLFESNKNLADSFIELRSTTYELRNAFIEIGRDLLGLSSSYEEAAMQLEEAGNNLADAATKALGQTIYGPDSNAFTRRYAQGGVEGEKQLSEGLTPEALSTFIKGGVESFDLFKDVINSFNAFSNEVTGPGSYAESQQKKISYLIDQGIAKDEASAKSMIKLFEEWAILLTENRTKPLNESAANTYIEGLVSYLQQDFVSDLRGELYGDIPKMFADGVDDSEIIGKLEDIEGKFKGLSDIMVDIKDASGNVIGQRRLVSSDDYIKVARLLFERRKSSAMETGDGGALTDAYGELSNSLKFAISTFQDIPEETLLSMGSELADMDKLLQKDLDSISKDMSNNYDKVKEAAELIVNAFNDGTITYKEAMDGLERLRSSILDLPMDLRNEFDNIIDKLKLAMLEGLEGKRGDFQQGLIDTATATQDYIKNLDEINEKEKEVLLNWDALLKERDEINQKFTEDASKIKKDSQDRIDALEKERAAIIGTFDFSETQNVRSKRFSSARGIENKILDEIMSTHEKLQELESKRIESLNKINEKVQELEEQYGSIVGVIIEAERERLLLQNTFLEALQTESALLSEISGKVIDLNSIFSESGGLTGFIDALGAMSNNIDSIVGSIEELPAVQQSISDYIRSMIENAIRIATGENTTPISHMSPSGVVAAEHGFSGVLKKPTRFIAGEVPEMVNITPLHKMRSGMMDGSVTNIYITEQLDLRGAYGINSPAMAEKVWKDVWAPARRRVMNRFVNNRGNAVR